MKSIITCLALAFAACAFAIPEGYKFPGYGKDPPVYADLIAKFDLTKENPGNCWQLAKLIFCKRVVESKPGTYADLKALSAEVYGEGKPARVYVELPTLYVADALVPGASATGANLQIVSDAFADTVACPAARYSIRYIRDAALMQRLNVSMDTRCDIADATLMATHAEAFSGTAGQLLDFLYDAFPKSGLSEEEQLKRLKKYNRTLSANLTGKYKAAWEPIIAKLRTVISAY